MRRLGLVLVLLALPGCTDLVTARVGAGRVKPIEVRESIPLASATLPACVPLTLPIEVPEARSATVELSPSGDACLVTVRLTSAVIVDRATIAAQLASLGTFDVSALVGIELVLNELDLTDGSGAEADVRAVAIAVDGQALFDTTTLGPQPSPPPRGALPESTVMAFRAALKSPADVRADLTIQLTVPNAAALPKQLEVRMVVQPVLLVDVVRAAL